VSADDWDAMVTVGRIVRPQGRRGEVVVDPATDFGDERFRPGAELWASRAGRVMVVAVVASWPHQGRWVLALAGVESIDEAETWRGVELRVPAEGLHKLVDGAFYVHDLLGCRVETTTGMAVGDVARVDLGNGTPLLVVTGVGTDPRGRAQGIQEVLVPLAESICRRIDVGAKVIVIDPPAGLLDLNVPGRKGERVAQGEQDGQDEQDER
jgi:16S rRNA processing protein RimM